MKSKPVKTTGCNLVQSSDFGFENIVNPRNIGFQWEEILYRPSFTTDISVYFRSMNAKDKVNFDFKTIECLVEISKNKPGVKLSVNISPVSLTSESFMFFLLKKIQTNQLNPRQICLEIVEDEPIPKLPFKILNVIKLLRNLGVWVALDDFGNGFAHWELLKNDLIDVLKIVNNNVNKSQFETLSTDCYLIGLLEFAKTQRISTVIEGIECEDDYLKGQSLGFDFFQGYYL